MKALVTCLALWFTAFLACASGEKVCLIKINGAIGPATASYISRSIGEAQSQNAQCLIIQLNTPGGLLDSTQVIVQQLLASPVPVVVYVAPIGATATSAGCFITLAASVAAMAPATTIGEHFKTGARKSRGVIPLIGWRHHGTRFSARSLLCPRLDPGDPPDALAALSRTIRQHPRRSSRRLADRWISCRMTVRAEGNS